LLCKLLIAAGNAGQPESHFHDPSISEWLSYYDLIPNESATEREVLAAIYDAARAEGTNNTGVFGLRLQRHSFDFFMRQTDILYPGHSSDLGRFRAAFGETLFIHLSRANKLEQAVSYVKASQTGLWHMAPDGTELERLSEPQEPVYDAEEIASQLKSLRAQDKAWEEWFVQENISPLRILYDDLSADPIAVLVRILEALGLDREAASGVSPPVAKLSDDTNRRWVERFLAEQGAEQGSQT